MGLKVNGIPYESWDDVPRELRVAIAESGERGAGAGPPGGDEVPEEEDELDRLVRLAEAREAGAPAPDDETPAPPATERCPTFELEGRVYTSLDDVPPEIRGGLRLQLLGPPAPTGEARLPAALRALAPPAVGAPPFAGIGGADRSGAGAPAGVLDEPTSEPAAGPLLPMRSKVAIAVMLLVLVALFLATRLIG